MKEIEITIDQEGEVEVDLKGFQGKGCGDITKQISKDLGTTVKNTKKPEFYKAEVKNKQKIQRGM